MQKQIIFDQDGVWLTNKGSFPFVDPTNGCRFEPNLKTKAPMTEWLESQSGVIVQDAPEVVKPKEPEKKAATEPVTKTTAEPVAKAATEPVAKAPTKA